MIDTIPNIMYGYAKAKPDKVINAISPSMVGRCLREHYYAIKHIERLTHPNPGALLNFEVGFLWEEVVANALRHAQVPFLEQHKLEVDELGLAGTLDFAVYDAESDSWEIWDSKTEGMKAGSYRRSEHNSFFEAHPEYVHQLNCYCLMLRSKGFTVSRGRFAIITKDNGMVKEEITEFTPQSLSITLERVKLLKGYLDRDEVPPCECTGWRVGYCAYGRPSTMRKNTTGKIVSTECCGTPEQIEQWRNESV